MRCTEIIKYPGRYALRNTTVQYADIVYIDKNAEIAFGFRRQWFPDFHDKIGWPEVWETSGRIPPEGKEWPESVSDIVRPLEEKDIDKFKEWYEERS